jgi:hypothetical protein
MFRIIQRLLAVLACFVLSVNLVATTALPSRRTAPITRYQIALPLYTIAPAGAPVSRVAPKGRRGAIPERRERTKPQRWSSRIGGIDAQPVAPRESKAQAPAFIPGEGPWMAGTRVAQTERLDLYVGKQTFSAEEVAALAPLIEQLLRDAERRMNTPLGYRVSVGFYRVALAPARDVRGMAYTSEARAELFYRPGESVERAATVAAHELGHHLEHARYGGDVQRRADTVLHEGLATWVVGERWLALSGATSWKQRARQLRAAGVPLRLLTAEDHGANNAYEIWASFTDFLLERYGWETYDALYSSGRGRAHGSSDYHGVVGKSLDELADEWRDWVEHG